MKALLVHIAYCSLQVALPEREYLKPALAASTKPDAKAYEFDACLNGSTTQVNRLGSSASVLPASNSGPVTVLQKEAQPAFLVHKMSDKH
jgi:hypothetical protein